MDFMKDRIGADNSVLNPQPFYYDLDDNDDEDEDDE